PVPAVSYYAADERSDYARERLDDELFNKKAFRVVNIAFEDGTKSPHTVPRDYAGKDMVDLVFHTEGVHPYSVENARTKPDFGAKLDAISKRQVYPRLMYGLAHEDLLLSFVSIHLADKLIGDMNSVFNPPVIPASPTAAIFYSINLAQEGMK